MRHRSEQNGRHGFAGAKRADLPHAGQATVRSGFMFHLRATGLKKARVR